MLLLLIIKESHFTSVLDVLLRMLYFIFIRFSFIVVIRVKRKFAMQKSKKKIVIKKMRFAIKILLCVEQIVLAIISPTSFTHYKAEQQKGCVQLLTKL